MSSSILREHHQNDKKDSNGWQQSVRKNHVSRIRALPHFAIDPAPKIDILMIVDHGPVQVSTHRTKCVKSFGQRPWQSILLGLILNKKLLNLGKGATIHRQLRTWRFRAVRSSARAYPAM
jgi:hypothetical protein